mmetsp:Transcript_177771/g.569997  ORF Transcript_177771/g.569997 Transcript_177771/m.569997 type:complete len:289 (+) Transcript_177771:826-1692(+)
MRVSPLGCECGHALRDRLAAAGGLPLELLPRLHDLLEPRSRDEADAGAALEDGEVHHVRRLERALDRLLGGQQAEMRLARHLCADVRHLQIVHLGRALRVQEGNALLQDENLVVSMVVDPLRNYASDDDGQDQRRYEAQVLGGLDEQDDDRQRHVREASKHGCTPDHAVDAGVADVKARDGLPDDSSDQAARQHRWHKGAHGHWQTRHPTGQRQVREEGQEQRTQGKFLRAVPREKVLYRALCARKQEARHLVVGAFWAGVAHAVQAVRCFGEQTMTSRSPGGSRQRR